MENKEKLKKTIMMGHELNLELIGMPQTLPGRTE